MENNADKRLLRPSEASEVLSTPFRTLARWRARGIGPQWFSVGKSVYCTLAGIDHWIQERLDGCYEEQRAGVMRIEAHK